MSPSLNRFETSVKITVHKAEDTKRGDGWYYLLNGFKDGIQMIDVGGDDWFSSEKLAREAAEKFLESCFHHAKWGWVWE